jgi:hypothetical protein
MHSYSNWYRGEDLSRDEKSARLERSVGVPPYGLVARLAREMVTSSQRQLPAFQSDKRRCGLLQRLVLPGEPDDCRSRMSARLL